MKHMKIYFPLCGLQFFLDTGSESLKYYVNGCGKPGKLRELEMPLGKPGKLGEFHEKVENSGNFINNAFLKFYKCLLYLSCFKKNL